MTKAKTLKIVLRTTLLISSLLWVLSCTHSVISQKPYTILRVQNDSQKVIFVTLAARDFKEQFVGIPPDLSAGISVNPTRIGDEVMVEFSEETLYEDNRSLIKTDTISEFEGQIEEIIFRYSGNKEWVLVLVDSEGNETFPNRKGN
ncbi:MAG: hypothetical protein R6V08_01695 [Desulfuromonadales bacterium]